MQFEHGQSKKIEIIEDMPQYIKINFPLTPLIKDDNDE